MGYTLETESREEDIKAVEDGQWVDDFPPGHQRIFMQKRLV